MLLEIKNLQFLDRINYPNFSVKKGLTYFIKGKSGCGKSSLFKLLNYTNNKSQGEIFFEGENLENIDTIMLRRNILLCGQNTFLFNGTILENFQNFYDYREEKLIDREKMIEYLKLCNIDFALDSQTKILSGGEKQRIFIAINLSFKPKILMLDEPTSSLDNKNSYEIIDKIKKFCKNNDIALLIISHDNSLIDKFADEVIKIENDEVAL